MKGRKKKKSISLQVPSRKEHKSFKKNKYEKVTVLKGQANNSI